MGGRGGSGTRNTNTGIPAGRPTKEQVISDIKSLKGKDLNDAIDRLDSFGDWYREDKRQKRDYLLNVVEGNYHQDPVETGWDVSNAIDSNNKILEAVYGISQYSSEFAKRFGRYDMDIIYKRRQEAMK